MFVRVFALAIIVGFLLGCSGACVPQLKPQATQPAPSPSPTSTFTPTHVPTQTATATPEAPSPPAITPTITPAPTARQVTVEPAQIVAGSPFTITASGFEPEKTVVITLVRPDGTPCDPDIRLADAHGVVLEISGEASAQMEPGLWGAKAYNEDEWDKPACHATATFAIAAPVSTPTATEMPLLTPTASPTRSVGLIYYTLNRGDVWEVYSIRPDGGDRKKITTLDRSSEVVSSPDGTKLAYLAPEAQGIEVINADGSGRRSLVPPSYGFNCADMAWSPDGKRLLYALISPLDPPAEGAICVIDVDGGEITKLIEGHVASPVWSPDGSHIAFLKGVQGYEVCMIKADGTGLRGLAAAEEGARFSRPRWSPDGKKLLLCLHQEAPAIAMNLFLLDVESGDLQQLTYFAYPKMAGGFSEWSPDGRLIAFTGPPSDIYVINADGTNLTKLTQTPADCRHDPLCRNSRPFFSPDGRRIAYEGVDGIYTMDLDGGDKVRLTTREGGHMQILCG